MRKTLLILLTFGLCAGPLLRAEETTADTTVTENVDDGSTLIGQWRRPDGGYVLEIKTLSAEGRLEAAYFNPRPIKVESGQWRFGGDRLQIRVRLNDTGYEGAFYLLQYDATTDKLVGEYHPASQETFTVEFERMLGPTTS